MPWAEMAITASSRMSAEVKNCRQKSRSGVRAQDSWGAEPGHLMRRGAKLNKGSTGSREKNGPALVLFSTRAHQLPDIRAGASASRASPRGGGGPRGAKPLRPRDL